MVLLKIRFRFFTYLVQGVGQMSLEMKTSYKISQIDDFSFIICFMLQYIVLLVCGWGLENKIETVDCRFAIYMVLFHGFYLQFLRSRSIYQSVCLVQTYVVLETGFILQ